MRKILARNKAEAKYVLVSDSDYETLSKYTWYLDTRNSTCYVYACIKGKNRPMHRYLLNCPDKYVDHIDGNGLNNQRENLRLATPSQSQWNRFKVNSKSGYKGVFWDTRMNKWYARIVVKYKRIYLGSGKSKEDIARLYDKAAKKYFGRYAQTNAMLFPNKFK